MALTSGTKLKGAMPLAEVYKIAIAVAEALAVAHRSGIVHRDLKPGNTRDRNTGKVTTDIFYGDSPYGK